MKVKFFTLMTCICISCIGWTQQLFGHINSQGIISVMPEAATAQLALQQELEDLQEQGKMMASEYEAQLKIKHAAYINYIKRTPAIFPSMPFLDWRD